MTAACMVGYLRTQDEDELQAAAEYEHEKRLPILFHRTQILVVVEVVYSSFVSTVVYFAYASTGRDMSTHLLTWLCFWSVIWATIALVTRISARRQWGSALTEAGLALAFILGEIVPCFLLPPPDYMNSDDALRITYEYGMILECLGLLGIYAIFLRTSRRCHALLSLTAVGACIQSCVPDIASAMRGTMDNTDSIFLLYHRQLSKFMFLSLVAILLAAHVHLDQMHRVSHADVRSIRIAASEREEYLQKEKEKEVQLRSAEAAKSARSRLIRLVMHDLRSPTLAISQAVKVVKETLVTDDEGIRRCLASMASCSDLVMSILTDVLGMSLAGPRAQGPPVLKLR